MRRRATPTLSPSGQSWRGSLFHLSRSAMAPLRVGGEGGADAGFLDQCMIAPEGDREVAGADRRDQIDNDLAPYVR